MANPSRIVVRIEGLQELEGALKKLRETFNVKTGGVIIRGMRKGMQLIRDEARKRAPEPPSGFMPSIIVKGRGKRLKVTAATNAVRRSLLVSNIVHHPIPTSSRLAGGKPTVILRVRNRGYRRTSGGRLRFNDPGRSPGWWWWLEFGTSQRPAQPFMRAAFEAQKLHALQVTKDAIRKEIDAVWQKELAKRRVRA